MREKRKHPRISVSLSATIRLSNQQVLITKIIELSLGGMAFLSPMAPEAGSGINVRFSLPYGDGMREFRLAASVRHSYEARISPDSPPDYHYVVGAEFMGLREEEKMILGKFLAKGI